MTIKLNLICAACQGRGIGMKGNLPWKLKNEMAYFTKMTTAVEDMTKRNAVIMGRKTWQSIPLKYRPLPGRLNIVLSKTIKEVDEEGVEVSESLDKALDLLNEPKYQLEIESVWIIGGSSIYKAGLESDKCYRVYYTDIRAKFDCDTFFPELPDNFDRVRDDRVAEGIQHDNGIDYEFQVYERISAV